MDEIIVGWLNIMFESEIHEAEDDIRNEHLWEIGYDGEEPNPHSENIERLNKYIELLNDMKEAIK